LVHTGYRRTDILRAYALFLILLPVVLTGVKNSLLQILFGIKAQFGRTPKIEHRTAVPLTVSAAIIALFSWSVSIFWTDVVRGDGLHAIFALSNVLALGYGLVAMIGLRAIGQDFVYAVSNTAVAIWKKLVPGSGRQVPEPVLVSGVPQLRVISAQLAPPLQAFASPANAVASRRGANVAAMPDVASVPLQPIETASLLENGMPAHGRRHAG
jgi:hypothetical protein